MEDDKKDYLITIEGKDKRHEIRLSAFMLNFGILIFITSAFIFIGTCSYSVYSVLHHKQNIEIINDIKRAGEMQQEQLLTVSRKAANLSETIQNLAQQEEELRIQAGLNKPAKEDRIPEEFIEEIPPENQSEWTPDVPLENPVPKNQSQWTPPAPLENPVPENQSQWTPPAPLENSVPENQSQWVQPAPLENPVPENQSQWTPPAPLENSVPENQSEWTPDVPLENPVPENQSQWTPPAPLENPVPENQSQWTPPAPLENSVSETQSQWLPPNVEGAYTGQGGPLPNLEIDDVSEALLMIEQRVAIRLESLDEFQSELKYQREQMSIVAAVPSIPVGSYENIVVDGGFASASSLTLDLGQFGGSPSVNPTMPSIWPTTGIVTSPYGLRWGGTDFHPGIDIANDMGTPIVATADGVVEYAGWNSGGYGNMVDINHGNGLMTRYGHASQVVVMAGQYVKRGQLIAYMGSTGFSTGPHVHYEVHVNGQRVNPISYL